MYIKDDADGYLSQLVNRFRCLKGWKQFGGSCYYPSMLNSSYDKVNETCDRLLVNNTHLMRVRHPIELLYGVHIISTNNLSTLLIEIDHQLIDSKRSNASPCFC